MVEGAAPANSTDDAVARHVEWCARCAASLALARRLDRLLSEAPPLTAPPSLVPAVLLRVSQERWHSEQAIDRWFTVALVAGLSLALGGLTALLNVAGLTAVALGGCGYAVGGAATDDRPGRRRAATLRDGPGGGVHRLRCVVVDRLAVRARLVLVGTPTEWHRLSARLPASFTFRPGG